MLKAKNRDFTKEAAVEIILCSNSGARGNRNCWQAGYEQLRLWKESVKSQTKTSGDHIYW